MTVSPPNLPIIVVPSYDQQESTTRCVDQLLQGEPDYHIVVVDHGHTDWTIPPGTSRERVSSIKASPDLWWSGAANRGIQEGLARGAPTIMLLNADCVLDSTTATGLIARSQAEGSIVAAVQADMATNAVTCAGAVPLRYLGFPTVRERTGTGGIADRFTIVCGGRGVAVPASVFGEVGLLDSDHLPHYWADHDFFLRCRRAGVPVVIDPNATVLVDSGTTSFAARTADLSWSEFKASLSDPKSHRNLPAVRAFFRRNYPIRPLHFIGSGLYFVRFTTSWAIQRCLRLLRIRRTI